MLTDADDSGVEAGEAASATELLLEHVTSLPRSSLRSASGLTRELSVEQQQQLSVCVQRRARHEPVQYILGEWDFFNLRSIRVRQVVKQQ